MSTHTHIHILLDRSGSMGSIQDTTIESINKYLADQKMALQDGDRVTVTLMQFNTTTVITYDSEDIFDIEPLNRTTYDPHGGTALYASIQKLVDTADARIAETPEEERPNLNLFVIITDGYDTTYGHPVSQRQAQDIVTKASARGYDFVFLGANIDVQKETESLGVHATNSMAYAASHQGMRRAIHTLSCSTRSYCANDGLPNGANFFSQPEEPAQWVSPPPGLATTGTNTTGHVVPVTTTGALLVVDKPHTADVSASLSS